jgi:NAD(P)-dependent dehydrogenase (short-subunit alcohol dehydrogenase family)
MKLRNKVAVITGGGRGIGRAIALTFAREGAKLVLMARTSSQLEAVCKEAEAAGTEAIPVTGDIGRKADIEALVTKTVECFGPPDIVVSNASITRRGLIVDHDDEDWLKVIETNLFGTYLVVKYFLRTMVPRGTGRIVSIASVAGKVGHPFNSSYAASKHGILGLIRTAALETEVMGVPGITVNAICPGATKTEMLSGEGGLFEWLAKTRGISREEAEKGVTRLNIQKRMLDPDEIAGLALYLASDEAKGVTGQAISIDGGQVMY